VIVDFFPDLPHLPEASCKDYFNPDLFFPETKPEKAKRLPIIRAICGGCPVRKECLTYAINNRIPDGYWGGLSPTERGLINTRRMNSLPTKAEKIRELARSGRQPEQIALLLDCQLNYVLRSLKQGVKNKGEAQLERKREAQPREFSSSSESQC
jgi:WhiB family redox-sensing transcriptional regulator